MQRYSQEWIEAWIFHNWKDDSAGDFKINIWGPDATNETVGDSVQIEADLLSR